MREMFRIPKALPQNVKFDIKSIHEEVANQISHGVGWIMCFFASPFILYLAAQSEIKYAFPSVFIYCFSLFMVYTSSTLYHSAYRLSLRRKLRIFDHISIYFLIAGSYTPYILMYIRTQKGYMVLAILWGMALIGSIFKLFFTHRFKVASTLAYLVMGWMAIFIYEPLSKNIPLDSMLWIKVGGAFYSSGIVFYLWKSLKQNHFIWHLFVLAGSIAHFVSVYYLLR
ncbi:MAG: hemolysin III [Chitinophagales bacterium]|jgi:hemolysin III